jgi:enoyl-CoA hydratase/carnithine racemase
MTAEALRIDRIGEHVLQVTINRPEKRNAINAEVASGMDAAVQLSETDEAIRAVVLTAAGEQAFCAGADLAEVSAGRFAELMTPQGGFAGLVEAKRTKPWIAAVDAPALGGGTEICLACDLIIASTRAIFGLPEVKRGITAGAGGVFRIARRVPTSIALELLTTGEPIDAHRAYEIGLINRVAPAGGALEAALAMAATIARNAPIAVRESLKVARLAQDLDEEALFVAMRRSGEIVRASEDFKEGPRAFLEKREPRWTGR